MASVMPFAPTEDSEEWDDARLMELVVLLARRLSATSAMVLIRNEISVRELG